MKNIILVIGLSLMFGCRDKQQDGYAQLRQQIEDYDKLANSIADRYIEHLKKDCEFAEPNEPNDNYIQHDDFIRLMRNDGGLEIKGFEPNEPLVIDFNDYSNNAAFAVVDFDSMKPDNLEIDGAVIERNGDNRLKCNVSKSELWRRIYNVLKGPRSTGDVKIEFAELKAIQLMEGDEGMWFDNCTFVDPNDFDKYVLSQMQVYLNSKIEPNEVKQNDGSDDAIDGMGRFTFTENEVKQ